MGIIIAFPPDEKLVAQSDSSSNCRNQSRYPILEWGVMNLVYANTGTIAGRIAAGLRILS
jgi:hypothetical protein